MQLIEHKFILKETLYVKVYESKIIAVSGFLCIYLKQQTAESRSTISDFLCDPN